MALRQNKDEQVFCATNHKNIFHVKRQILEKQNNLSEIIQTLFVMLRAAIVWLAYLDPLLHHKTCVQKSILTKLKLNWPLIGHS